ncbi:MAG: methyltransferase domain-containing protein [Deltaproteobacteria bacterium]|nr:methyltransferase domain-containing protein [Deltaproteobacteria bacterium]
MRDQRSYPVTLGIPDFRIFHDPSVQTETEKTFTVRLAAEYPHCSFAELLACFESLIPINRSSLAAKRRLHLQTGVARGKSSLAEIQGLTKLPTRGQFLEIGCGTGPFLLAAADMFQAVVGLDISMPRLILAKKRLEEAGRPAMLTCACAESLPFSEQSFHLVVGSDMIEHVADPVKVIREGYRVLVPDGAIFLATPNRWSLTAEPHVNVWGVGFLPKGWRERYVELVQHVPYRNISLLNWFELRRLLRQTPFTRWRVILPSFPSEHTALMPVWARAAVPIYDLLRDHSLTKWLLYMFGPLFHVVCFKR